MTVKLEHTFTLRIPGDTWVRMEKEIAQGEYTRWIIGLIKERLYQLAQAEKP